MSRVVNQVVTGRWLRSFDDVAMENVGQGMRRFRDDKSMTRRLPPEDLGTVKTGDGRQRWCATLMMAPVDKSSLIRVATSPRVVSAGGRDSRGGCCDQRQVVPAEMILIVLGGAFDQAGRHDGRRSGRGQSDGRWFASTARCGTAWLGVRIASLWGCTPTGSTTAGCWRLPLRGESLSWCSCTGEMSVCSIRVS